MGLAGCGSWGRFLEVALCAFKKVVEMEINYVAANILLKHQSGHTKEWAMFSPTMDTVCLCLAPPMGSL